MITVCDNAKEHCPIFPSSCRRLHWNLNDPATASGMHDERLAVFRRVRDEITERIHKELLAKVANGR